MYFLTLNRSFLRPPAIHLLDEFSRIWNTPEDSPASYLLLGGLRPGFWSSLAWQQLPVIVAWLVTYKKRFLCWQHDQCRMKVTDKQTGAPCLPQAAPLSPEPQFFRLDQKARRRVPAVNPPPVTTGLPRAPWHYRLFPRRVARVPSGVGSCVWS